MLVLGISLLVWLLWRADFKQMGLALGRVNMLIFVLAIAADLITPIFRAHRFACIFNVHGRILELSGFMGVFNFMNMIFPLRSGEVVFLMMLKKRKIIPTVAESLPRWIVLRAFDLLAIMGLILVAAIIVRPPSGFESLFRLARIIFGLSVLGMGLMLLVLSRIAPPPALPKSGGFIQGRIWALRCGLQGISDLRVLFGGILWSAIIWIWLTLVTVVSYLAFQINLPFHQILWVVLGVLGFSILPLNAPGGLGTLEAIQVALLCFFGIPESEAIGVAIGVHAIVLLTSGIQGLAGAMITYALPAKSRVRAFASPIGLSNKELDG